MAADRKVDETPQVNCDEDWLVIRAKQCLKCDPYAAKAWLITARTLFPKNFRIQYEAYQIEKNSKNVREVARILEDMFISFPNEKQLWQEVRSYSEALQCDATDEKTTFQKHVFAAFPASLQYHMLVKVAETTQDVLQQCRLMLLILNKYPDQVPDQGVNLVDSLLSTEKRNQLSNPVNCYRKYLVCHVLPQVLKTCSQSSPKLLYRWLQKAIEFYLSYITDPPVQDPQPLSSPDLQSPTSKLAYTSKKVLIPGLSEKESHIENPWEDLFQIMKMIGQHLDWDMAGFFDNTSCGAQWQRLQSLWESTTQQADNTGPVKQVLYCATIMSFHCLYKYACHVDPGQFSASFTGNKPVTPVVLVEMLPTENTDMEHKSKKSRRDIDNPALTTSPGLANSTELLDTFLTALRCWELLHGSDLLRKEFNKLLQHWKYDTWSWLQGFEIDVLLHQGYYKEAITQIQIQQEKQSADKSLTIIRSELQLACCHYFNGSFSHACDKILKVIAKLPSSTEPAPPQPLPSSSGGRHLQLMTSKESEIMPYCIHLLITCYKEKAFNAQQPDDTSLGHMLVLLQYDWPKYEQLFCELLHKIRYQGSFTYNLFFSYMTNIDILEEFAFLKNQEGGRVNLDIMSTSTKQLAQTRTVTRGVNKGVKEDFKAAIEKQVSRSEENIEIVIRQFLVEEGDILRAHLV